MEVVVGVWKAYISKIIKVGTSFSPFIYFRLIILKETLLIPDIFQVKK